MNTNSKQSSEIKIYTVMLDKEDQIVRVWPKQHCSSMLKHIKVYPKA